MIWALVLVWASGGFEITTGWPTLRACEDAAIQSKAEAEAGSRRPLAKAVCMNARKITT
jgi:hypothetical protein